MKQTKHLRQALWRTLLCLTVLLGFASSGLAAESYKDLYLVGDNFGRWNIDQSYKMSREGNVYTITVDKLEGQWKIWDGSTQPKEGGGTEWDYSFGADSNQQPTLGSEGVAWFKSGTNFSTTNGKKTKITFTLVSGSDVKNSSISSKILVEDAENVNPPVSDTEYDFYLVRSRDWNKPQLLEGPDADGNYTFTGDMNANGQFGIRVVKKGEGGDKSKQLYWYTADVTVAPGTNEYPLSQINDVNITLPNKGGKYTLVVSKDPETGLPKTIKVTTPEFEQELDNLYIGGSWMGDQNDNLTNKAEKIGSSNGKYDTIKLTFTSGGDKFRFYSGPAGNLGAYMGTGTSDNYTFTDNDFNNTTFVTKSEFGKDGCYVFPKAGTYTIKISSYKKDNKAVTFTVDYTAPEKNLYLGASFKGNLADPNYLLKESNGKYPVVKFTKFNNSGDVMFRFANELNRNCWMGPEGNDNTTIRLSNSNTTGNYTTASYNSLKTYIVENPGVYELRVTNWDKDYKVSFTLTRTGDAPKDPYYFVGDMNDWFSNQFEDPNAAWNMERFMAERDDWQFRDVTQKDYDNGDLPAEVKADWQNWYVFDNFPGKQLSGQFQITSGGNENFWNKAIVYGNGSGLTTGNVGETGAEHLKRYADTPFTDEMIKNGISMDPKNIGRRDKENGSFPNFHKECNAVDYAKIYFKPGTTGENGTARIILKGEPRYFFIFYANEPEIGETPDDEIRAIINPGKPNRNNYFLPGIDYGNFKIPNYIKVKDGDSYTNVDNGYTTEVEHMNIGNGVKFTEIPIDKMYDESALKDAGLDEVTAKYIAENKTLPNKRSMEGFKNLYIARVPKGFENPAGWKYTISLTKALNHNDTKKSVALACNHIYFMPTINGVSVHLNDDELQKGFTDPNTGVKVDLSEYVVQYYYRIYYSTPNNDKYEIRVVDHRPGNIVEQEATLYVSEESARKPTLEESESKRNFGWKPLNLHASPIEVNNTISDNQWESGEKGWQITEGNTSEIKDEQTKWHICWVESTDRNRRQRIPKEFSNAYVQILACYFKDDNAYKPKKSTYYRAAEEGEAATEIPVVEVMSAGEAIDRADRVSIEPASLTFKNDAFHHPLQGNHLYYVMKNNYAVWTGVEEIENDMIVDEDVAASNAAPVYYNLQGVRVAEPTNGIFIEVRGNKSRKVIR